MEDSGFVRGAEGRGMRSPDALRSAFSAFTRVFERYGGAPLIRGPWSQKKVWVPAQRRIAKEALHHVGDTR
jgi:hypothetical protein